MPFFIALMFIYWLKIDTFQGYVDWVNIGNGKCNATEKSNGKATVGNGNYFSVTPLASLDNTSFQIIKTDGVTQRKGNGKACYFLI